MVIVNITTTKTAMSVEIKTNKKELSNKDKNNEPND